MSHDELLAAILHHRGIEPGDACPKCSGMGVRWYSSTATWRGGIGGQACTRDVCDACWGSGSATCPWTNLRTIDAEIDRRAREISEARWREITGAPDSVLLRASVGWIADEVAKLARKRPGGVAMDFWQQRACEYVASMLRGTVGKDGAP